jgi:P-type E1-E2 ATPase
MLNSLTVAGHPFICASLPRYIHAAFINTTSSVVCMSSVLQVGDVLKVLPGAAFPADGTLLAGSGSADESLITGETLPVPKQPGDAVIGGSVNGSGLVLMCAGRVGPDTVLSSIVRLVQEAQANKAAMQVSACVDNIRMFPGLACIGSANAHQVACRGCSS